MPTARGLGFLVAAVGLFLVGGATNVGWVRIVDAVLWGMLGLSLALQWFCVTALSARLRPLRSHPGGPGGLPGPMEDDEIEIEVELRNRRFWPRYFLSVGYDCPLAGPDARAQRFFAANLSGHGTVRLVSRVRCYRRGLHHLGPVEVESLVPFGLFRRRRRHASPLSVLVYPRAVPMTRMALLEGSAGEDQALRRSRVGYEIAGSRPYRPGDPSRHIHWRNTARLGELAVKEFEESRERAVTVAFDVTREIGGGRETTLEYAVKLAASVGLLAQRSGDAVHLLAGRRQGWWADAETFLRELAVLEAEDSPPLEHLLASVAPGSPAIIIIGAGDVATATALARRASQSSGLAAVVLDGFGEGGAAHDILRTAGVPTVVCRCGALAEAVRGLERLGLAQVEA